jgi:hypothetical protein
MSRISAHQNLARVAFAATVVFSIGASACRVSAQPTYIAFADFSERSPVRGHQTAVSYAFANRVKFSHHRKCR